MFDVFFATRLQAAREATTDLLNRLPPELRRQVQPFAAAAGGAGEPAGGGAGEDEGEDEEDEKPPSG